MTYQHLNKRIFLVFFGIIALGLPNILGQTIKSKVNLEEFNADVLTKPLLDKLNAVRKEKNLPPLVYNEILSNTALDQAEFNRKSNTVGDEQSNKKKASTFDRAKYYKGLFQEVNEYDLGIEIQTKAVLKSSKRHNTKPSTYESVVNHIVEKWVNERKLDDILYSNVYHQIGFGFAPNHIDGVLFSSIVVASEPYLEHQGFKYHSKSYKLTPYDKNTCKTFERNFQYLSELFSENLIIKDDQILFYYHDLSLIESLFQTNRDAMAVDILKTDQFQCEKGNALHPSSVYDGIMLKPIKKSKLLKGNSLKEQKEFLVSLGNLPPGLDSNEIALSLIIIQNKCACKEILSNNLNGKNIRLLEINLAVDTISISQSVDSNTKFLSFTIPFEKNKSDYIVEDIKPFLDSIQLNRFNIKEINIKAFSSIEGNPVSNEKLQQKRAESILNAIKEYQLQTVKTKIETEENWDGFFESINGSPYEADYKGKEHNEVRSIVNSDTLIYDLEPYLKDQRKAEIRIFVESIFIDSLNVDNLHEKFIKSIKEEDFIRAKAIQTLMYRAVLKGEMEKDILFEGDIPQFKEYVPLSSNRLAYLLEFDEGIHADSLIDALKMEVDALLGVDPANGHVNFNRQAIKLYYWAKDLNILIIDEENKINQPKDFYKDIRKLYNTKIDNFYVNRLLMNYNIIAADYYYERQDYKNRNRALKQVRKYVKKAKLNRDQTYTMSRYFIFQMQIDWAVQIMLPYINKGDFDDAFLLTFLRIAVYDEKHVSEEKLYDYFQIAAENFPDKYCGMFGKSGMSLQFLSDLTLKSIYCNTCH